MDKTKIIQLRLLKSNFKRLDSDNNYSVFFLDYNNYLGYLLELNSISGLMNEDFDWVGIPNEKTLHKRFINNSHCLLWKYNDEPIGWAWSNYNITPYWEDSIQKLDKGEIYGGGAFLSKKVDRPADSGLMFYNLTFNYWLNILNNNCIYQYSDDWNRVSSIMSHKCGFEKFNFLV